MQMMQSAQPNHKAKKAKTKRNSTGKYLPDTRILFLLLLLVCCNCILILEQTSQAVGITTTHASYGYQEDHRQPHSSPKQASKSEPGQVDPKGKSKEDVIDIQSDTDDDTVQGPNASNQQTNDTAGAAKDSKTENTPTHIYFKVRVVDSNSDVGAIVRKFGKVTYRDIRREIVNHMLHLLTFDIFRFDLGDNFVIQPTQEELEVKDHVPANSNQDGSLGSPFRVLIRGSM
jgi:hypothetical protein